MLSIAAGNRRPLIPDFKFDYPEPGINEDLYQIIKYSADEMCTTMEQSDKIMRLWTAFLEPIFGVPSRPHGAEDTEEAAKVQLLEGKENCLSNGESGGSAAGGDIKHQGLEMEMRHATSVDELTIASKKNEIGRMEFSAACRKTETGRMDRSGLITGASTNGEAVSLTSLTDDMKVDAVGTGGHKNNTFIAGNLQQEMASGSGLNMGTSEMHCISDPSALERLGDETCRRSGLDSRMFPEISSVAMTSWAHHSNTDRGHDMDIKEREFSTLEEMDRRSSGPKRESRMVDSKLDPSALRSREDFSRAGLSGRMEREEGELSPSPDAEDGRTVNYGSGDNLASLGANVAAGSMLADGVPNHAPGVQPDEDENGEAEGEHDVDADDEGEESAQKTGEDSENVSEAGEEISGSESGDSHEDHEEDEDDDEEHEGKNESEGEADGLADANDGEVDGTFLASSDRSLLSCKPLAAHGPSIVLNSASERDSTVFYGNNTLYVLFRLHQALYDRIHSAKLNAKAAEQKWKTTKDASSPDLYGKFMRLLYSLLDGSADNAKFEDDCRALIGTQSYVLFTLDKLIFKLIKQLQAVASDEMANKLLALYSYEKSRAPCGLIDVVYHANACVLLHDENIYRFEHRSNPNQLSIQLMEGGPEKLEVAANAMEFNFSKYLNDFLFTVPDIKEPHPVFLARNKLQYAEDDEYTAMVRAMTNVRVANGLEYKISCNTSKVSYVLDTEDLFHRGKRKRVALNDGTNFSGSLTNKRVLKFHKWIDSHASRKVDKLGSVNAVGA